MSVEIQIRTSLQAAWANLYERLGDRWGREIRYGESDDVDVTEPGAISSLGTGSEGGRRIILAYLRYVSLHVIADIERTDQDTLDWVCERFTCHPRMDSRLRLAYLDPKLRARYPEITAELVPFFDRQVNLWARLDALLAKIADAADQIPTDGSDEIQVG